ncbi:MAG: M14 family zinc carboxypeptidase [Bacteroidota bacterium]
MSAVQRFAQGLFVCLFPLFLTAQVTAPGDFLPHQLGETFTPHHLLVDYFEEVADASNQVQLIEYGRSNEQRPLLLAFVSSAENLRNLAAIQENHLRSIGVAEGQPDPALDRTFVWMSFGVHGNEGACSEASMGALYELLSRPECQEWLENTIVMIDPAANPDGYSRYTHWYRGVATKNSDPNPAVREHREPWPGGRTNHYMFDLNRDWAWQTQIESQQRIVQYQQWLPHIHADFHEQWYDNPYYFAPAAQPYHSYLTEWQSELQVEMGKNHARYFDQNGWLYFTREVFDLLYPSYGDTYPMFNGAIGMTYEQGGHSRGGTAILLPNTDTLTLYDRVTHHVTTAISTVEVASNRHEAIQQQFKDYFIKQAANPPGRYKAYVIKGDNPQPKLKALVELLDRNGIEYGTTAVGSVSGFAYQTGKNTTVKVNNRDLVISAYQPRSVLTQVLLEPETEVIDSLTYDITAWSLPYAYGLEAYASASRVDVKPGYDFGVYKNELGAYTEPYAYLVPWTSTLEARFLGALLQADIQVRAASKPFQLNGKQYDYGTLVVTRADNRKNDDFDATVKRIARELEVGIFPVNTGMSDDAPDLGSDRMKLIDKPRVALIAGEGTYSNVAGQVWHYLEQRIDYPVHIFYPDDLKRWSGEDIDVLILPEGYYDIDSSSARAISDWVRSGGKLIGIGAALASLSSHDAFGLSYMVSDADNTPAPPHDEQDNAYSDQERRSVTNAIPGAIFEVKIDRTHPLGYGLDDTYFSLKTGTSAYGLLKDGWNVGTLGANPRSIGFVGDSARKQVQHTLVHGVREHGSGTMIYLVDNPLYRGFWENGTFLFGNALFMVGN